MDDTYFDLASRLEEAFPEIVSDIVTDLQQQISDMKQQYPKFLRLRRKLDDMEREQLYFREHTDAIAYLRKIKAL